MMFLSLAIFVFLDTVLWQTTNVKLDYYVSPPFNYYIPFRLSSVEMYKILNSVLIHRIRLLKAAAWTVSPWRLLQLKKAGAM